MRSIVTILLIVANELMKCVDGYIEKEALFLKVLVKDA